MSAPQPPSVQPSSLQPFVDAGVIDSAAHHFARRVAPGASHAVALGAALAVQAVLGSDTCLDLDTARDLHASSDALDLDWPDPADWKQALAASDVVCDSVGESGAPLVLDGALLFLRRFHLDEAAVADDLLDRAGGGSAGPVRKAGSSIELDDLFPINERDPQNRPRRGAELALSSNLTILTGGPGTGKTHTLSRIVTALWRSDSGLDIALAAPTGKAATRMRDAIAGAAAGLDPTVGERLNNLGANTIHRLLGLRPGEAPRYNRNNPLPHHVVIVDEASMVSLPLMADLLAALQRRTKLVLVGDPYQLASVEAGSVLGDLVNEQSRLRSNVAELTVNYRSIEVLDALSRTVNAGDADSVIEILRSGSADSPIEWIEIAATESDSERSSTDAEAFYDATADLLETTICDHARRLLAAGAGGDLAVAHQLLGDTKILCATRLGPLGVRGWTERIETAVVAKAARHTEWYDGRPVMVTRNDYITGLLNGDTGVTIGDGTRVSFPDNDPEPFGIEQLSDIETWWAMTIHKSQGSEFRHAIVCLDGGTRISSRELLYTALTRAKERVTVVASEAAIRATVERRSNRTSGLRRRLSA